MITKASFMDHPFHPMLIVFPLGLWVFSFVCCVIFKITNSSVWNTVSIYSLGGGIIGGVLAALPGIIDLFSLPPSRAQKIGIWHMIVNINVLTILIIVFFLKIFNQADLISFILFIIGIILLGLSGWLGGELVYVNGVAVKKVDNYND
jgi:uncharacterized membrane protein